MQPFKINLHRARREAKALLAAARAGDHTAQARFQADRPPRLSDALHLVAQEYGARRWTELVQAVEDPGAALRRAARRGDDDLVNALLEAGAPPNSRDPRTGRTAFLVAAAADQLDTVSRLVTWVPVDLCATDRRGRDALDLARPGSPVAAVLSSCGLGPTERGEIGDDFAEMALQAELALYAHLSHAPGVHREALGDGYWFRTGLADNTRNVVVCGHLPPGRTVGSVLDQLRGVPACWYPGLESADHDLAIELEAAGARAEQHAVHMAAPVTAVACAFSPDVREAHRPSELVHLDRDEAEFLASAGPPLRHLVIGDVAGLTLFMAGSTALGINMKVARPDRRRGHARTLVQHAVALAQREGADLAVLSPTAATIPLYERLGFTLERSRPGAWWYLPSIE